MTTTQTPEASLSSTATVASQTVPDDGDTDPVVVKGDVDRPPQTPAPDVQGDPPDPTRTVVINPSPQSGFHEDGTPATQLAAAFAAMTPAQQSRAVNTPDDPSVQGREKYAYDNLMRTVEDLNAQADALRGKGWTVTFGVTAEGQVEVEVTPASQTQGTP